jgi:ABC-2 type transport system ATP-binding protein
MSEPIALSEPFVRVAGLTKRYGRVAALADVSLTIRAGEILGLIGPNGAGKTTLFECLSGVQPADSGVVTILNAPDGPRDRASHLFYIPDGIAPWPEQTVEWMLDYTLTFFEGVEDLRDDVVSSLALGPLLHSRIGELSKGQRKRALLGMGLLAPQPILLIDEPFEGLDLRQGREIAGTLRAHAARGRTLFVSIHQIIDAGRFCDRFVLLSGGRVCAEGTRDELTHLAGGHPGALELPDFEEVFLALT